MTVLEIKLTQINGGRVLDVATGKGYFIKAYIKRFRSVTQITAIDLSLVIEELKEKFNDFPVVFQEADAAHLPFENSFFDTVCISNSLHHMICPDKVLREMDRVLKKDGHFIINEMYADHQKERQLSHVRMHHWKEKVMQLADGIPSRATMKRNEILSLVGALHFSACDVLDYDYEMIENSDPKYDYTPEDFPELFSEIDSYTQRVSKHPQASEVVLQGEQLKKRICEIGFAPASSLFILGTK